jgi:hypothetical protein
MRVTFELLSILLVLPAAFWAARPARALGRLARPFVRLARRRWLAVVVVGLAAMVGSVVTTLAHGWPEPDMQDEYSYLLMADTFAHGRLTNPPHPLWQHFETFQIIQQPTYASKYPPAQGVALVAGLLLTGQPIVGVWLSLGLACAAICWMLQAWLPPRWALFGATLMAVRLVFSRNMIGDGDMMWGYWSRSYCGGAMAALGGALLFGALRRLIRRPRAMYAVVLGLGLALLANSRPFEGLIVSLPAVVVLLVSLFGRNRPPLTIGLGRVVLPLAAVLAVTAAMMAFYNFRVTGDPLRLPYQVHEATYAANPLFVWQPLGPPPPSRHPVIANFWTGWVRDLYRAHQSLSGFLVLGVVKVVQIAFFYLGLWLLLAVLGLRPALRDRWTRFALLTCGLLLVMLLQLYCYTPHYAAPMACLLAFLAVQGLRQVRQWQWAGRSAGRVLVRGLALAYPVLAVLSMVADAGTPASATHVQRTALLAKLRQSGEQHLVVVRYLRPAPHGRGHEDWVFNEADIDAAPVVWAREMNPDDDRRLLAYYPNRRAWLLEVEADKKTYRLSPHALREKAADGYPPGASGGPGSE